MLFRSPRDGWPNKKAEATSANASDIIKKTKKFLNIKKALKEFNVVFSFSARERDINKKHITMNDFFNILNKNKNQSIGLMFGPEASGLSNYDLSYSNYILQIPTAKNFKSLNLSHSVTIVCYEIFKALNNKYLNKKSKNLKISSKFKVLSLVKHLTKLLEKKDFFLPIEKKQSMLTNINNLIYRLEPNDKELRILASIITSLYKKSINDN